MHVYLLSIPDIHTKKHVLNRHRSCTHSARLGAVRRIYIFIVLKPSWFPLEANSGGWKDNTQNSCQAAHLTPFREILLWCKIKNTRHVRQKKNTIKKKWGFVMVTESKKSSKEGGRNGGIDWVHSGQMRRSAQRIDYPSAIVSCPRETKEVGCAPLNSRLLSTAWRAPPVDPRMARSTHCHLLRNVPAVRGQTPLCFRGDADLAPSFQHSLAAR